MVLYNTTNVTNGTNTAILTDHQALIALVLQ